MTLHEMVISGDDAWVTANKDIPMNLSKYGGSTDGVLDDSAVQEYDIATGKLLYTWDALDHIPLTDSKTQPPPNGFPWDAYHVNSIDIRGARVPRVHAQHLGCLHGRRQDRAIEWQLGGKHSTFQLPPEPPSNGSTTSAARRLHRDDVRR